MIGPANLTMEMRHEDRVLADVDCMTAVSALAGDSAEMLRDRLIFCHQFVIEDPYYPTIVQDTTYFVRIANRVRDCRTYDWDEK